MRGAAQKRQTWRRTSRELHYLLSRGGRKWVKEVWQPARELAQRERALSRLANAVGAGIAESCSGSENPDADEAWLTVIRTGCATGAVFVVASEHTSSVWRLCCVSSWLGARWAESSGVLRYG